MLTLSTFLFAEIEGKTLNRPKDQCQHDEATFRCVQYLKNYDADTITFNIPHVHPLIGEKISVRVFGVDAPEIKGKNNCEKKKSKEAKLFVENLLKKAQKIDLVNVKRDKYFRILAEVMIDGKSLGSYLKESHMVNAYFGKKKEETDWCAVDFNPKKPRTVASE